ncbi:MAG: hypothetical protein HYZ63_02570 [Candidatus Andersenbacteria bacterium]|nr:hypothetical protein [Candidatus Andersenbacteria bacterium]
MRLDEVKEYLTEVADVFTAEMVAEIHEVVDTDGSIDDRGPKHPTVIVFTGSDSEPAKFDEEARWLLNYAKTIWQGYLINLVHLRPPYFKRMEEIAGMQTWSRIPHPSEN